MRTNLLKIYLIIFALLSMSIGVIAQTTVWNPAANHPSDGLWTTSANWTSGVPVDGSKVVFNVQDAIDCIVDTDVSADIQIVQGDGGTTDGSVIHIKNGGVVTTRTDTWSAIGYNKPATLIVDQGGEITFGQHMWIANQAGASPVEVQLNGGTINIGSMFGMDWNANGNTTTLHLNDGLLNLANIHPTQSIGANSQIIIDQGEMQIAGDHTGVMQSYIDDGKIVGKGGAGLDLRFEAGYTKLNKDVVVNAVPVPILASVFGFLGIGAGLFFRRKRKQA